MTFKPTHRSTIAQFGVKKDELLEQCQGFLVTRDGRTHLHATNPDVEPIPQEEPVSLDDNPQVLKGKRYRIEFTAEQDDYVGFVSDYEHIKVELLPDPLPTTPGSVVKKDELFCLHPSPNNDRYNWRRVTGSPVLDGKTWVSDAYLVGATVLFDAGAPRESVW